MKVGFIFDLDGLLVNTQLPFHAEAESRVLKEVDTEVSPASISNRFAGISTKKVFNTLAPLQDSDELVKRKWEIMNELVAEQPLEAIPYMLDLCEFLKENRVPICIASASPRSWIELCLQQPVHQSRPPFYNNIVNYGQIFGENYVSAEECSEGKPSPAIIYKAIDKCKVRYVDFWFMVGDGESDVESALNASIGAMFYAPGNPKYINNMWVRWFEETKILSSVVRGMIHNPISTASIEKRRRRLPPRIGA